MAPGGSWAATTCANGTCAGSTTTWIEGVTRARHLRRNRAASRCRGRNRAKVIERLTDGPVGDLPFMGCGRLRHRADRCKVGRLSVSGELGYEIHCRAASISRCAGCCWRPARIWVCGDRVQRAAVAAAGEELRHLVGGIHPGLHAGHDRHGSLDRLGQGRFRRPRGGAGRARRQRPGAGARDAGGRRRRGCRCQRVRAGLARRQARRLRHLGRLRPHLGKSLAMAMVDRGLRPRARS
jgi:hypothetical protein